MRWTLGASWLLVLAMAGCGSSPQSSSTHGSGGGSGTGGSTPSSGSGGQGLGGLGLGGQGGQAPATDFPATPILDTPAGGQAPPADVATLFGPEGSGDAGGPCLVEPATGTLFPSNWTRPRFVWAPAGGEDLFELRIKTAQEISELVVYTTATQWTMPKDMWKGLASHAVDVPLTVTIRGATLQGSTLAGNPKVGTSGDVRIAPAAAAGSIVYWRTVPATNTGELKGFAPGDEAVALALQTSQVAVKPGGASVGCIGCHTSTPDGKFAAFKTLNTTSGGALASIEQGMTGQAPTYWSMASINAMNAGSFGIPSFSKAHWADGDRTLLTSWGNGAQAELAWFNLETTSSGQGTAFDFIKRDGDSRGAIMPSFSHDGSRIAYTSTNASTDGRPTSGDCDVFTVPYASKQGGTATPVQGAADPAYNEYYPAFSPDDQLIAFNRINKGVDTYNQPAAEVFVIPSAGGTPTRLGANDPVACSGKKSPGVTNSWPKWAPEAVVVGDRTFYWIAFSSTRGGSVPQLYMTAVVVQGGQIQTYPALYIWAQPAGEANHTPAWDVFKIPVPPTQ